MTTLVEHIIVAEAKNRTPILEKSMYDSWASRIRLFIKGKKNGRMMLDFIDNGPLVYFATQLMLSNQIGLGSVFDCIWVIKFDIRIMNKKKTQQVIARDEKLVLSADRVKISSTNLRLETTMPQKEETFQVVIDVIKNSTCFKAFTISTDVSEIFMQQFWSTSQVHRHVCGSHEPALKNSDNNYQQMSLWEDLSAGQIPLKKSRGNGSQGMKTVDDSQETVDVSKEFESEIVKKKTASRRVVKKKVIISTDDNIIPDLDVALELGKSISLTKAKEEEATKQVYATHVRIMTESIHESTKKKTGSRSSRSVVIQDTLSAPKPKPATSNPKLKGAQSLTPVEKEATDIMQALKESKKTSKRQPGGSSEGTRTIPWVPNESTVKSATSNEGTSAKPGVPNEEKDDKEGDADDEGDDHISDTQATDDENDKTESDEDEIYKYKIRVRKDEDVEMTNAKIEDYVKGDAEIYNVAQADVKKTKEIKDDAKKAELPPSSSSLSVSLDFDDHFLKLSSDNSLVSTVKDNTYAEINSLLEVKIQFEVPHIQSPSILRVPISMISKPTVLTPVQETSSVAPVTTLPLPSVFTTPRVPQQTTTPIPTPPITTETSTITTTVPKSDTLTFHLYIYNKKTTRIPIPPITIDTPTITTVVLKSDALYVAKLRVAKLEKDMFELKKIDLFTEALAALKHKFKSSVPTVVDDYLGSKLGDALQKALQRHSEDLIQKHSIKRKQAKKYKMPKYNIKSTDKAALKEYDQKSALYQTMHENKSFNKNLANHKLYHALMEALIDDENAMGKGVVDTLKDHKRMHDDDDDHPAGPNQGKKTKRRITKELESLKKPSSTKETPKGKAPSKGSKTSKYAFAKEPGEEPITEMVIDDVGENVVRDDDQPQDTFYSFKPGLSHRCGTFKKFNTHRSHLNESPIEMLFSTYFPLDQLKQHLALKSDTAIKYSWLECDGYMSATSLLVAKAISSNVKST
uniref:Uncharacterized protein n=1 Tax=Tanacetum cinerariifolium TaxID=118510 RepID=A0A6L2LTH0_TANCI|nr:hypothetical protein [Tanacetum cinerariifolium]